MKKLSLLSVAIVFSLWSARAATVTTTADDGPGSLRDAIKNAAVGETIDFGISGVITLTSGELAVTTNLTIAGPGASHLMVQRSTTSGTPGFRIFSIQSGTIFISGLGMSNGLASFGGGLNNNATLTLRDCAFLGNLATDRGGGINNQSTLTLSNCVISGNSVTGGVGGGLNNAGTVTASDCTVTDNSVTGGAGATGSGGGINNEGTLTLNGSGVTDNSATGGSGAEGAGGGNFNQGTVKLGTTTIGSNLARGGVGRTGRTSRGGGIANDVGTVTLDRSTVSGNSAEGGPGAGGSGGSGQGGGIANALGTVTMENSTVSGNVAGGGAGTGGTGSSGGGGIFNDLGTVSLTNSTISANVVPGGSSQGGGGILNSNDGVVELKNSIIAANTATVDLFNDASAAIQSGGFNLIGSTNVSIVPGPSDRFNITAAVLKLGPLQDNGGPTFTHALLCGSPAINAGDNTDAPATDQRGFPRIVGGVIDIGAFEDSNRPPTIICPAATTLECRQQRKDDCHGKKNDDCRDKKKDDCRDKKKDDCQDKKKDDCNDKKRDDHHHKGKDDCDDKKKDECHDKKKEDCHDRKKEDCHDKKEEDHHHKGKDDCHEKKDSRCPPPTPMVSCPTNGIVATVSVDVADPDGDRLAVVWTVDGTAYQTNNVAASGPPTTAHVDFMAAFGQGIHDIGVSVTDAKGCEATCSTTLTVVVVPEKDDP